MALKRQHFRDEYLSFCTLEGKGRIVHQSDVKIKSFGLEPFHPPEAPAEPVPIPQPQPQLHCTTTSLREKTLTMMTNSLIWYYLVALSLEILPLYHNKAKVFHKASLPPKGCYVVLGIFDESGILMDEVIMYMEGRAISRQLVEERRKLFRLPILRDIKAFKLYKVSLLATC